MAMAIHRFNGNYRMSLLFTTLRCWDTRDARHLLTKHIGNLLRVYNCNWNGMTMAAQMGLHTTHNGWSNHTAACGNGPCGRPRCAGAVPGLRAAHARVAACPSTADHHGNLRHNGLSEPNGTPYTPCLDYDSNGYPGAGSALQTHFTRPWGRLRLGTPYDLLRLT